MRRPNRTNEFLRDCMADALLRLMQEKPLEGITVSEITRLAGVGRTTYYRNFESKEDILRFKTRLLWKRWQETTTMEEEDNLCAFAVRFFRFLQSEQAFLQLLADNGLFTMSFLTLYEYMMVDAERDRTQLFHRAFEVFGMMGAAFEWLKNGMKETPEELAAMLFDQQAETPLFTDTSIRNQF